MNNETSQFKKHIAVYGRVSTSNQENEGTIETQLSAVREKAQTEGLTIVKEYLDEGWSGDTIIRPALDQLRVDARKGIWDAVLMYDPDRLARRFSYQELVSDELKEAGIEVMYVTTDTPKNSEDKILFGVKGLFAEYERSKIAERFRLGKVRKAKDGNIIVAEAPYGYTFIPKKGNKGDSNFKHGYYEINEREAEVVRKMFSWVAHDQLTMRAIVRKLRDLGIPPRKSKRGVWSTSTLSSLFKNRTYIGEGHFGASYAVVPQNPIKTDKYRKHKKSSRRMKPKEDWIIIKTPAIVDKKLFDMARVQIESNFALAKRNKKNEYLLAGKMWCSCNSRRTGEGALRGKYLYYRCSNRVNSFPLSATCDEKGINARIADDLVWKSISDLMRSPELMKKQLNRWVKNKKEKKAKPTINVDATQREIKKLKMEESRYVRAFGEGVISMAQLKEFQEPIQRRLAVLQNQIAKASKESAEQATVDFQPPSLEQIEEFAKIAQDRLKDLTFGVKKAILDSVVQTIVGTQKQLLIRGRLPLPVDLNVWLCSNNRGRQISKYDKYTQNYVELFTKDRNGANETRQTYSLPKGVPFELILELPPPLRRGNDYGFRKFL